MDALSFRNALQAAKPQVETLLGMGLTEAEASKLLASWDLHRRSVEQDNQLPDPTLNEFFARYDATDVTVGMVYFPGTPELTSYGYYIGQVEADLLVLNPPSGEIEVRDHACTEYTIWKSAKDGASFLSALAEAAKYLSTFPLGDEIEIEPQRQALERCTLLAGGEPYESFYQMLLGVE